MASNTADASAPVETPAQATATVEKLHDKEPKQAAVGTKFQVRTEVPDLPPSVGPAFAQSAIDDLAAGNHAYTLELKEHGHLGLFLKRPKTTPKPRFVNIYPSAYIESIELTLEGALKRLLRLKSGLNNNEVDDRAAENAAILATGCVITTYLKVRAIILGYPEEFGSHSLKRPRVSSDLPIPSAFAFAIQQLGAVKVADLDTDLTVIPCFPKTGHNFGLPIGRSWNSNAYNQAVEYAKSLGMQFNIVDLKVKNGSAWWLLRQYFEEDIFELQCPVPEVNFTDAMAVTHSIFLRNTSENPSSTFINLTSFGDDNYGTIMVNPHPGINLSSFEALSGATAEVWKNV